VDREDGLGLIVLRCYTVTPVCIPRETEALSSVDTMTVGLPSIAAGMQLKNIGVLQMNTVGVLQLLNFRRKLKRN